MENLKIRVNSEAESKEVQGSLEKLGFKKSVWGTYSDYFIFANSNYYSRDDISNFSECDYKEITLPELRDLVILKRNDVGDATHENIVTGSKVLQMGNKNYYWQDGKWNEYPCGVDIKPIEKKEMKEYLRKNNDGEYILEVTDEREAQEPHAKHWIEIPEGATYYAKDANLGKSGNFFFRLRSDGFDFEAVWLESNWMQASFNVKNQEVLWQRPAHPEELPFIDDEPLQSLNDQYAEIEKVRQSAWQKQEGGSHYKNIKIQPMRYALENKLDYAQANVVKYVTRHKEKNGKEDLLKAIHNIELMIEFYYGGGE